MLSWKDRSHRSSSLRHENADEQTDDTSFAGRRRRAGPGRHRACHRAGRAAAGRDGREPAARPVEGVLRRRAAVGPDDTRAVPARLRGGARGTARRDRGHRDPHRRADLREHDRGDGAIGAGARPRRPALRGDAREHEHARDPEDRPRVAAEPGRRQRRDRVQPALFERIEAVYEGARTAGLTPEQTGWRRAPTRASSAAAPGWTSKQKARLSEINQALAGLFSDFAAKVLADENTWTVLERREDLAGLPDSMVAAARAAAEERGLKGRWAIVNTRSSVDPFLTFSTRRDLREQVWKKFKSRGDNGDENDTKDTIRRIVKLRAERAALLGYESHAHWRMDDTMARDPEGGAGADVEGLARGGGAGEGGGRRHAGDRLEGRRAHHDRAVGLPVLSGEGPQGAVRPRPGAAHAVLPVGQHDRGRHVVGRKALRPRVRGDHRHRAGVPSRRARVGGHRRRRASRPLLPGQLGAGRQALGRVGLQLPRAAPRWTPA
jgi:hypothetical protein